MRKDGGGKTHFIEVAQNLVIMGHELLVLLPGYRPLSHKDYGLNIRYVPTFRKNVLSYLLYEFLHIFYLIFHILKFKPDAIYSRSVLFDLIPPVIAKIFKVPYVIEKNGIMEDELNFREKGKFIIKTLKLAEKVNFRLSRAIVCVTKGIKREFHERYRVPEDKMYVVPNGVNPNIFYPMDMYKCRRRIKAAEEAFYIGFVGSFAPWQGIEILIESAKIVKDQGYSNIKYLLVGDGELIDELKRLVIESSLVDDVVFYSRVAYEEVPIYVNSFDIAVYVPKTTRNKIIGLSPLKLYEYLSCGKPVIASRIDGLTEVVEGFYSGYVCDPDEPSGLATKIIQAFNERQLLKELGRNGRILVENRYTWMKTAQLVVEVLKKSLGKS